jgi:hypothetical protein
MSEIFDVSENSVPPVADENNLTAAEVVATLKFSDRNMKRKFSGEIDVPDEENASGEVVAQKVRRKARIFE